MSELSFTDTSDLQESRGRKGTILMPFSHFHQLNAFLQLYFWNVHLISSILSYVIIRLFLDQIYAAFGTLLHSDCWRYILLILPSQSDCIWFRIFCHHDITNAVTDKQVSWSACPGWHYFQLIWTFYCSELYFFCHIFCSLLDNHVYTTLESVLYKNIVDYDKSKLKIATHQ